MQRLNLDSIGPLPTSKDGHKNILLIIDTFSRFVELYPIKDTSAIESTKAHLTPAGRWGYSKRNSIRNGT